MKFKIEKLDVSVAVLAALSCLFMVSDLQIPVWAVFIGWAWYFTLGAKPELIKQGVLPALTGGALAVAAFLLIELFANLGLPWLWPTMIAVLITVFALMLTLKVPVLNHSLMSFNAYSCVFVGTGAVAFLPLESLSGSSFGVYVNAFVWIVGGNLIGLIFGWLSIKVTTLGAKSATTGSD
ncbi:MAG: DUF1097 domain-containing protein [Bifidobacteriaceae bacterium]|jgi:hypothetical protein|nr:DUF1097 domain-containing protein [Bifidobacteriaceae bacterium]